MWLVSAAVKIFHGIEGAMHTIKLAVVMVAIVAAATLAFAAAPSEAQTTTVQDQQRPARVATTNRSPARLTVRKRSYLDPGTETKRHDESYLNYAYPPSGNSPFMNPTLFYSGPGLPVMMDRMPFPNCFDLNYCNR